MTFIDTLDTKNYDFWNVNLFFLKKGNEVQTVTLTNNIFTH